MSSPAHRASNHNLLAHAARVRFFWLLAMLVGFILVVPSMPTSARGQWEIMILGLLTLFAAIFVSQGTSRLWAIGLLSVALLSTGGYYIMDGDPASLLIVVLGILLATLVYTATCVLTFVLDEGEVGIEHIYGAICAYILIAMAFGTLYFMLELHHPASFTGIHTEVAGERPWWQFFYFSFTTLSTVGYGDIVPATMRARSFTIIEQLVAIFYVAILISRLTGMYTSSSKSR